MAAGAGAEEATVGAYDGTEKRDPAIAGNDLRFAWIYRQMQSGRQKVCNECNGIFEPFPGGIYQKEVINVATGVPKAKFTFAELVKVIKVDVREQL